MRLVRLSIPQIRVYGVEGDSSGIRALTPKVEGTFEAPLLDMCWIDVRAVLVLSECSPPKNAPSFAPPLPPPRPLLSPSPLLSFSSSLLRLPRKHLSLARRGHRPPPPPQNGNILASGCDKTVQMWDLAANRQGAVYGHDAPVRSVRWVADRGVIASGGWDKQLKYWDLRASKGVAAMTLPERVYAMDVQQRLLVLGLADRQMVMIDVGGDPTVPYRVMESPLKFQTRAVACFPDGKGYAMGSIEGRASVRYVDKAVDEHKDHGGFQFKCHRKGAESEHMYPLNSISFNPHATYQNVFITCGGDGGFAFWHKIDRVRLDPPREDKRDPPVPITASAWHPSGQFVAYAHGYDWSMGMHYDPSRYPTSVHIHRATRSELENADAATRR